VSAAIHQGKFITLEGGEGAGKSTQIERLADRLQGRGLKLVTTREPGGSPGAEDIRNLLVTGEPGRWSAMTEALLFAAARNDHLNKTIRPALEAGKWVICDRFADSTRAYQGVAEGLSAEAIETLDKLVVGETQPDLTLILDLPVKVGLERATHGKGGDENRYERMGTDFHERLRKAFLEIARAHPERCVVINASGAPDKVADAIWSAVTQKFSVQTDKGAA